MTTNSYRAVGDVGSVSVTLIEQDRHGSTENDMYVADASSFAVGR